MLEARGNRGLQTLCFRQMESSSAKPAEVWDNKDVRSTMPYRIMDITVIMF